MARDYGRLRTSIWSRRDFTDLLEAEQRMYALLLSQDGVSYCGVLAYTPRRWAGLAKDSTEAKVRKAVTGLVAKRYVIVDEATDEILVRSFIRHDGTLTMLNVAKSAAKAWHAIHSSRLKGHVLLELHRLKQGPQGDKWEQGWPAFQPLLEEPLDPYFPEGLPEGFGEGLTQGFQQPFLRGVA